MSLFPTIVDMKERTVFCRACHRWEYIAGFSQNMLKTQCGKRYEGPFAYENTVFNYGYDVVRRGQVYSVRVKGQTVVTANRRLVESFYELNLAEKVLYKNGKSVFEHEDLRTGLCPEITADIVAELGESYKERYGIQPTVASGFKGFNLIIGYMLSPFNINFYKIAQHWGLNPYDKDFASLSSGDTPTAENEMFESLGLRPSKTIRKLYQQFPQSVVCCAAAKDLGFTDVNIIRRAATPVCYAFFKYCMISFAGGETSYPVRPALIAFVTDLLALSNQKTVWNSLERTFSYIADSDIPNNVIIDGINAWPLCNNLLTTKEKKDVLHEGFNQYTHDFLVRRIDAHQEEERAQRAAMAAEERARFEAQEKERWHEENEMFAIESQFLDLAYKCGDDRIAVKDKNGNVETIEVEDDDRYCFYVAQSTEELHIVGSEMHNCVGWGYAQSVRARKCTIVYAKYKHKYKICIEVTPDFTIRQSLGPHNQPLQDEALVAYHEWCREKHIVFKKAFCIRRAR